MKYTLPLALLALPLISLAGCGDADLAGAMAATTSAAPAPDLFPVFDADGTVLRDDETDLPVLALRDGADLPVGLVPAFDSDGRVKRCPLTGAPLGVLSDGARLLRLPE